MLKKIQLALKQNHFFKNVMAVAGGTAGAQAITMSFAPLITRLYGPETFGLQGIFMSLASILAAVAALTYPIAIVLPKSDVDARGIARLSIYVGLFMAILTAVLLWMYGEQLLYAMQSEAITDYIFLLPLFMLFSVYSTIQNQWLIRKKKFKITATVSIWHSLMHNSIKAGAGVIHPSAGVLITTSTFGSLLQALMTLFVTRRKSGEDKDLVDEDKRLDALSIARRYRDFPLLRAPQVFINAVSHRLPTFMLAVFFGPAAAGFYTLASTVLAMPSNLIGSSVMQVFYPKANETHMSGHSLRPLIIKTTMTMTAIGVVPFLILVICGPFLFKVTFGSEWEIAGKYGQWLAVWMFFNYINKPAVASIPVLGIQKGFLIYEIFSTATKLAAIGAGYFIYEDALTSIALFSIVGAAAYIYLIYWVVMSASKPGEPILQNQNSTQ